MRTRRGLVFGFWSEKTGATDDSRLMVGTKPHLRPRFMNQANTNPGRPAANHSEQQPNGEADIHSWIRIGDVARIDTLINSALEQYNVHGFTALHVAVMCNQMEAVTKLLSRGVQASVRSKLGDGPLHIAASHGFTSICQLLLGRADVSVDAPGRRGWTALHYASEGGDAETMRLLIQHGANVNAQGTELDTPLHLASVRGLP